MRLSHMPLSLRVPVLAAGLMVLVGLVASQQVLSALGTVQDARLRELARLHIDGLSVALGPFVLRKDVWEVFDTLDRARAAMDGQRLLLTVVSDDVGRVLAASDPLRAPVDSAMSEFVAGAGTMDTVSALGADPVVRVLAPLEYQGRTIGQILTELDVSDLLAERRHAFWILLLGNALAVGVLSIGGYVLMRRMLRPITLLAAQMAHATGTPEAVPVSLVPKGDSELARLVQTYNAMSSAVEAKAEAERRLAERERFVSLGRLSSSLAHEINNPLGGLLNAADTILYYADRPDVVRTSAALIDRGLRHLRDVARATLDQNRLDRLGVPLSREDFDDLHILFEPEAHRRGLRLDWRVNATGLPALDSAPVRQIALNLLLNAAAVGQSGGKVSFVADASETNLRLTFEDSGPGLPYTALRRLLTAEPMPPGGGVGLRLVHDLVAGMGGQIDHFRSTDTTILTVTLPVASSC